MSKHTDVSAVRQRHLPHEGEELPGAPPPDALTREEAERNAEALIHSLIVEQKREASPKRLPPLKPQDEIDASVSQAAPGTAKQDAPDATGVEPAQDSGTVERDVAKMITESGMALETESTARPARRKLRLLALPRLRLPTLPTLRLPKRRAKVAKSAKPAAPDNAARDMPRLRLPRFVRNYRPTPRHLAFVILALIAVMRPLLLPIVAVLTFWLGLIVYLTLGPERCAEMGAGLWTRFAARYPDRAERVRRRADAFAERFDRLLDRLPERWADRLALPDFSGSKMDDADRPDPFDRLAAQARDA